jgi:ABC-2 type transport system permease protein
LVKKEIKESIRNPRFIVFTVFLPLILYPIMGFIVSGAMSTAVERAKTGSIQVVDRDLSNVSASLINYLQLSGLTVELVDEPDLNSSDPNLLAILVIPDDFGERILNEEPANLTLISILNGINIGEQGITQTVTGIIEGFKEYIKAYIAEKHGINPNIIVDPFVMDTHIYVRSWGREFSMSDIGIIMMQIMFWPWLIFSLVVSVIQLSAIFLGEEKEQKTLEILLTLPVSRTTILFSKVMGSGVLAILATLSYSIGFIVYINVFSEFMSGYGLRLEMSVDPLSLVLMGGIFFLTLLFSSALGLTLSVLAQDTKSAESLAGVAIFPLMLIAFMNMFVDISTLPQYLQVIVYLIPYTYLMEGFKYLYIGNYYLFLIGIIVNLVGATLMLALVSKIFTTERILTMRIKIRRRKT